MKLRPWLDRLEWFASWLQSPLLLVIRLYWGISFVLSGWGKFTHLERTVGYFESLNIPMPKLNAIMAASTECGGGALLALGLFSRLASLPLIGMMAVAYLTANRDALVAITSDPDKFVTADSFLFLLAALLVLAFGPGKLSLDALFSSKSSGPK